MEKNSSWAEEKHLWYKNHAELDVQQEIMLIL